MALFDPVTELYINGAWVDVTAYVRYADGVTIERGRADEQGELSPSTLRLTLNNRDGRFSNRNPTSPYYGLLGRNTPLRQTVDGETRFVGEVSSWPARWDLSGRDVFVPIEAAGITRRLTQGASPLRSAIYRNLSQYDPLGYWPLEDDSEATTAASAVTGGQAAAVTAVTFGSDDTLPGASTTATLDDTTSRITATVRRSLSGSATGWSVLFFVKLPAIPGSLTQLIKWTTSSGAAVQWYLAVSATTYDIAAYDESGTQVVSSSTGFGTGAEPNQWIAFQIETEYAAGTTTWANIWHAVGSNTFWAQTSTYSGTPGSVRALSITGQTALTGASYAHLYVGENSLPFVASSFADASNGYQGETAITRFERLCAEEGVTSYVHTVASDESAPMGRQQPAAFVDLIGECADADRGILYEARDQLALAYWPRTALYNGTGPTFHYGTHIAAPFEPVDDDQQIRNQVTVSRPGGSSATEVLETGPLSVQAPPDGVGRYDTSETVNVYSDDQLPDLAGLLVFHGTLDALRYPQVTFNLANSAFTGDATRTGQVVDLDIGGRFDVDTLPAWLPPDPAQCLVQGYSERISTDAWTVTANTTPAGLWDVAVADTARVDTDGSELNADVTSTGTTLVITTTDGPTWSTDSADYPLDIAMGGERITLGTAPGGSTSPQTFTGVTRSVNGVVKAQTAGTAISLWAPAYVAL